MQRVLAAALVTSPAWASSGDHPVGQVIDLLKELQATVKEEGQTEELTFAKFDHWCASSLKTVTAAISGSKEKIEILDSTVASKTKGEAVLKEGIKSLEAEIMKYEASGVAADKEREEGAALYTQSDEDFQGTITAIDDAITALKGAKEATASALVQSKLSKLTQLPLLLEQVTDAQRQALMDATSAPTDDVLAAGDASAHQKKYNFKSGNVVELLKELKMKFEDDRVENTKAETNSLNSHDLAKAARENALTAAQNTKTEKETLLGETQEALNEAKSELESTQGDLEADSQSLTDTSKGCSMKKSEWTERQNVRANEIKAMAVAVDILAKVSGVRTEAPSNPVPPPAPVDASMLRMTSKLMRRVFGRARNGTAANVTSKHTNVTSKHTNASSKHAKAFMQVVDPKQRAITLLRAEAKAAHSKKLAQFADQVAAHLSGPFDDVNNMIQKMVFRLMAEGKDEDDHKNWCDLEMSKTNTSRNDKTDKIANLGLKIEEKTASGAQLMTEATEASEMAAKLAAHVAEATEIRQAGKAENSLAVKDAKKAQDALSKATAVLSQFYKGSAMIQKQAWELLQQAEPVSLGDSPSTWDTSYSGVSDPSNQPDGIVAMLKRVSADFAQMEADSEAQEAMDQRAYDEEMKSCKIEESRRSKEAEMKEGERARLLNKVTSHQHDMKHVQSQLNAADQYWKDLGPACMDGDSTYEARKADREKEISALKEAQVILADAFNGEAAAEPSAAGAFLAPVKTAAH